MERAAMHRRGAIHDARCPPGHNVNRRNGNASRRPASQRTRGTTETCGGEPSMMARVRRYSGRPGWRPYVWCEPAQRKRVVVSWRNEHAAQWNAPPSRTEMGTHRNEPSINCVGASVFRAPGVAARRDCRMFFIIALCRCRRRGRAGGRSCQPSGRGGVRAGCA